MKVHRRLFAIALLFAALAVGCGSDAAQPVDTTQLPPSQPVDPSAAPGGVDPAPQQETIGDAMIALAGLDEATNALLTRCAMGDDAACDAAQVPGVLNDGNFSAMHVDCDGGDTLYCDLFDRLVEAEIRLHEAGG